MPCSSIQARFLQDIAEILASSPASNDATQNVSTFDPNAHFSPTMAIILVVLVATFFFMAFFSIYVKRCSAHQIDHRNPHIPADLSDIPSQGVDAAFLETLPLVAYSSSKKKGSNIECVVCLVDFEEGEPLCQLPRCKHVFHKECIDMWLFSHSTCPLCRHCVITDGTHSLRWGGGSGRLPLTLGLWGSRRGSRRGSALAPMDGQGRMAEHADGGGGGLLGDQLLRSHSTGHSLGASTLIAEAAGEVQLGSLPLMQQAAAFQRSRSVAVMAGGDGVPVNIGIAHRMREAGASFQRAVSLKNLRQAGSASASAPAPATAPAPFDQV